MKRNRYNNNFNRRKHSGRGIFSTVLGVCALICVIVLICVSFSIRGEGTLYIGTTGFTAMIFSLIGMIMALSSFKEMKVKRLFSVIGLILNALLIAGFVAIYLFSYL